MEQYRHSSRQADDRTVAQSATPSLSGSLKEIPVLNNNDIPDHTPTVAMANNVNANTDDDQHDQAVQPLSGWRFVLLSIG